MNSLTKTLFVGAVVTTFVCAVGGWAGVQYGLQRAQQSGVHDKLHHELGLTAEQESRISTMERQFAEIRRNLEAEMRAANRDLAAALQKDHTFGSSAKQAIERFHAAMGALQEQTVIHVLAMRQVLTPQQAEQFDRVISDALVSEP